MDVSQLDASEEINMRTTRGDGSWSSRPIWVVSVGDEAYVRSALGRRGAWYRRVLAGGDAEIEVDGESVPVALEPIHDDALNKKVSDAYRAKYARTSPGSTEGMVEGESVLTTLRMTTL
jgi:hypothetical protein